jgi:hypothetical protein
MIEMFLESLEKVSAFTDERISTVVGKGGF